MEWVVYNIWWIVCVLSVFGAYWVYVDYKSMPKGEPADPEYSRRVIETTYDNGSITYQLQVNCNGYWRSVSALGNLLSVDNKQEFGGETSISLAYDRYLDKNKEEINKEYKYYK